MHVPQTADLSVFCLQERIICSQSEGQAESFGKLQQLVQLGLEEEIFFTSSTDS